jgi:hypothetical protein
LIQADVFEKEYACRKDRRSENKGSVVNNKRINPLIFGGEIALKIIEVSKINFNNKRGLF